MSFHSDDECTNAVGAGKVPGAVSAQCRSTFSASPVSALGHRWWVLGILGLLMGFASISTDLYLPAMPTMSRMLNAGTGMVEWTIAGYLFGFSAGQLLWGPVSDSYGRRKPLALGLALFVIGSAGCALAGSAVAIIGWRIVQAVGASAGVVLSRAMVRDLYEGPRAAQMLSVLLTVMAIAPLLGPMIGGQILWFAGWRAIFWVLVAIGLATLLLLFTMPETHPPHRRIQESLGRVVFGYGILLSHRRLLGYAGAGGLFYGGLFASIAGTPFAYITYHHVPAQFYGLLFAAGTIGIMIANMLNIRLVPWIGSDRILMGGTAFAALCAVMVAITARTDWGGLWGLALPLILYTSATGFIVANAVSGALNDFPSRAGTVSAFVGAVQYGCGIIGSGLVGIFADGTPWPMGWVIAVAGLGSFASATLLSVRSFSRVLK
jgi:MFS transporter, DHA1 family, multidrug resistance protein